MIFSMPASFCADTGTNRRIACISCKHRIKKITEKVLLNIFQSAKILSKSTKKGEWNACKFSICDILSDGIID